MAYNLQNLIKSMRTPEVRELAWVIGSNPLFDSKVFSAKNKIYTSIDQGNKQLDLHYNWLLELDSEPATLQKHLSNSKSHLLGKRFESLLKFWLNESRSFELLMSNKQLIKDKTTYGEIDFIFRDVESEEVIHLEVACKFYLAKENKKKWNNFVGPNGSDNLHEKMSKLDRQLKLFKGERASTLKNQLGFQNPRPHAFLKGYLFHHITNIAKAIAPKGAHPKYNSAWYIRNSETHLLNGESWCLIEKSKWLSTINGAFDDLEIHSKKELTNLINEHFKRQNYAICIAQLIELGDGFIENTRGIVVPNNWQT